MKRIIGRTVGTNLNPEKLKMESAEGMPNIQTLQNSDALIVYDLPGKKMAKITWDKLRQAINSAFEGYVLAGGILDSESGYTAVLPELEDDAVIALVDDITKALKNYYTSAEVDERISAIPKFTIEVVSALPTENISDTTVYLVVTNPGDSSGQLYTEYIYVNGVWEKLGEQKIDLTGYVTTEDLDNAVDEALTEAKESGEFNGRGIASVEFNEQDNEVYIYYDDGESETIVLSGRGITEMYVDENGYLKVHYAGEHGTVEVGEVRGRGVLAMSIDGDGHLQAVYTDDPGSSEDLGNVVGRGIENVWVDDDGNLKLVYDGIDEIFDLGHVLGKGIEEVYIGDDGILYVTYSDGESRDLGTVVGQGVERLFVDENGDLYVEYSGLLGEYTYVGHVLGEKGDKGDKGDTGATGAAGYTPVKGTDYFTAADKAEMVNLVLSALPTWNGGSY